MGPFSLQIVMLLATCLTTENRRVLFAGNKWENITGKTECDECDHEFIGIEDVFENVEMNSTIKICSNEIILETVISIADVRDLSILGYGATIKCSGNASSGFQLTNASNFIISDLIICGCAHLVKVVRDDNLNLKSSLSIVGSLNIELYQVRITSGPETGLAIINTECNVTIANSSFENNGHSKSRGGNGIYVELSTYLNLLQNNTSQCFYTNYILANTTIAGNTAHTRLDDTISGFSRFDKGGGLCVLIRGKNNVVFKILNCSVYNNTAYRLGGGVYIVFHGSALNSAYVIEGSNLTENKALHGGGLYSGYLHVRSPNFAVPQNCSYFLKKVLFKDNTALFGGGISFYSTKTKVKDADAQVNLANCTWDHNEGQFGSALAVLPNAWNIYTEGYLPTLTFNNTMVKENIVKRHSLDENNQHVIRQYLEGAGAFYCSFHTFLFNNKTTFIHNNGSSLYMETCIARFRKNSIVLFSRNEGYRGGAIFLLGSILYLHDNTTATFDSNRAYEAGGAIFYNTIAIHTYDYSKTCFIDYSQDETFHTVKDRNIFVHFRNNQARDGEQEFGLGHSIFTSSLKSCYDRYVFLIKGSAPFFDGIGTFSFSPVGRPMEISTTVNHSAILYRKNQSDFIPVQSGREETILIEDRDDLNQTAQASYYVSVLNHENSSSVILDEAYRHISRNQLLIYGKSHDTATVILSTRESRHKTLVFNIKIKVCPPGFVEQDNISILSHAQCVCSAETQVRYIGINKCKNHKFKAIQSDGYWVGYESNTEENENTLLTGYCPFGFCAHKNNQLLPSSADKNVLSEAVCVKYRKGILCGECKQGLSIHYHSLHLECKSSKYCSLGWLFYILAEVLPVTVIFTIVVVFNIPFTSGLLNGFIFYCQVVVLFPVTANNLIPLHSYVMMLNRLYHFIYLTFNLKPLVLSELSFCVIKNGSALDIISLSYFTLIFSFILLIVLLVVLNKCKSCNLSPLRRHIRFHFVERSTIHGLTAFLILCYAQCGRTSILLLRSVKLYGKGPQLFKTVLYYNGELEWMSLKHLHYAIPAIIIVILVILLPPITLLMYPLHFRVLAILKVGELKIIKLAFKPIDNLKPFLDSFQGSFKDEYRFFAGLYFIYRLIILLIVTLFKLEDIYFLLEVLIILMILLHTICQPYKIGIHNKIDTLLFINLAIINTITLYNFTNVNSDLLNEKAAMITSVIQSHLIILPLIVIMCYLIAKSPCVKKMWNRKKLAEEMELSHSITCRDDDDNSIHGYYSKELK